MKQFQEGKIIQLVRGTKTQRARSRACNQARIMSIYLESGGGDDLTVCKVFV